MLQDELPEIVLQRKIFRWRGCSRGGVDGKQIGCDEIVLTKNYRTFDGILQFPDITRPGITGDGVECLLSEFHRGVVELFADLLQQEYGEFDDVPSPFTQRRQIELHHPQAEVEVAAKFSLLHPLFEILVGGGDETNIHLFRPLGTDGFDLAILQYPQQPCLSGCRQFADLVKKEGAPIGAFDQPSVCGISTDEGAFLVTEEF